MNKNVYIMALLLVVAMSNSYGMGWRGVNVQKGASVAPVQTAQPKSPAAPAAVQQPTQPKAQPQYFQCQGGQCKKITAPVAAQPKTPAAAPVYKCVGGVCKKQQPAAVGPMFGKINCKGGVCKLTPKK